MAKSKVIDGYSYEFNSDGNIVGVFNHDDPFNAKIIDPNSNDFKTLVRTNGAAAAYNFNKYGGNKDSYENSVSLTTQEELNDFYEKESKDNKQSLNETEYPNIQNGISNPSVASKPPATSAYAAYKDSRGKKVGTDFFTYPLDIDPKQDHLKISKYKYARNEDSGVKSSVQGSRPPRVVTDSPGLSLGDRLYNIGKPKSQQIQAVELQQVVKGDSMLGNQLQGSVMLPMPKVVDTNGCEWGESEVNIFGLAALGAFQSGKNLVGERMFGVPKILETDALQGVSKEDLLAVEKITARGSVGKDMIKNFKQGGSALLNAAAAEATARATGQSISQDQILARTSGRVLNPNAELLFQGPVLRDFNFDFLMIARSESEGKEIRKIIRWFKSGMAPKFNSATFLETPDVFTLEYRNGTRPADVLKTVNRFSPGGLALRTIAVDYAPSGYWSAYQDSQPVAIKMSLNFAELRPIYSQDQNQDELTDTVGY